MGFEPTVTARPQCFSRAPQSSTLAPLHVSVIRWSVIGNQSVSLNTGFTYHLSSFLAAATFGKNCCSKAAAASSSNTPLVMLTRWLNSCFIQHVDDGTVCAKACVFGPVHQSVAVGLESWHRRTLGRVLRCSKALHPAVANFERLRPFLSKQSSQREPSGPGRFLCG